MSIFSNQTDSQNPNLARLAEIANQNDNDIDVPVAIRIMANVMLGMEMHTLRDIRARMANFERWYLEFGKRVESFIAESETVRREREDLELRQAEMIVAKKGNMTTSQKITAAISAHKSEPSVFWRDVLKSVVSFVFGGIAFAIITFILQGTFGK